MPELFENCEVVVVSEIGFDSDGEFDDTTYIEMAGFGIVYLSVDPETPDTLAVELIEIGSEDDESLRGNRYGSKLGNYVIKFAREGGFSYIAAEVSNERIVRMGRHIFNDEAVEIGEVIREENPRKYPNPPKEDYSV